MAVNATPATARTDVIPGLPAPATVPAPATGRSRREAAPARPMSDAAIRRCGLGLAAGAGIWAATMAVWGASTDGFGGRMGDLGGLAFQLGVFALLQVQLRTRAIGTSRKAVGFLYVEHVLLGIAALWSLLHAITPETGWLVVLDVFWPLSMLGMFAIGIKIARTGRWTGSLRVWPLVAESWAVVTVPAMGIFGDPIASNVGAAHLLVGYVTLGVLLARNPGRTRTAA